MFSDIMLKIGILTPLQLLFLHESNHYLENHPRGSLLAQIIAQTNEYANTRMCAKFIYTCMHTQNFQSHILVSDSVTKNKNKNLMPLKRCYIISTILIIIIIATVSLLLHMSL